MLTNTEIEFIRQNYQTLGATDCANQLNRSRSAIIRNAKSVGLILTHEHRSNIMRRKLDKPFDKRNVNPTPFIVSEKMKDVNAYLLGFIWADGYVSFKHSKCQITCNFVHTDSYDIHPLFNQTGKWGVYIREAKGNCKKSICVSTNNRPFAEFLNSMDYITKSHESATKILNFIPTELHRYWWLGCMDGDGGFYIGKTGQQIGIHSSYTQDWSHFEQLANQLGIDYRIDRRVAKKGGKSSSIRIVKKESCAKFIHYLYPNDYEFGLKRKFQKTVQMLERCENTHIICPHCKGDIYVHKSSV